MQTNESTNKKDFYKYLIDNKDYIIAEKKQTIKHSELINIAFLQSDNVANKAIDFELKKDTPTTLYRRVIANSTLIRDSHKDVHKNGWAAKTLKENKRIALRNQHRGGLENILIRPIMPYTIDTTWQAIGFKEFGNTQILVIDLEINKNTVPDYIWDGFLNYTIDAFSVGMQYVDIKMAINDSDYKEEFAIYNQYINEIVNKDEVNEDGYFYLVSEAKLFEISPVDDASNNRTGIMRQNSNSIKELQQTELEIIKNEILENKNEILALKQIIENNKPQPALEIDKIDEPQIEIEKSEEKPDVNEINKLLNLIKF